MNFYRIETGILHTIKLQAGLFLSSTPKDFQTVYEEEMYCTRPLDKIIQNRLVVQSTTCDYTVHLFPHFRAFWFLEKTALRENRVSGVLLMFQQTRNSRISGNLR